MPRRTPALPRIKVTSILAVSALLSAAPATAEKPRSDKAALAKVAAKAGKPSAKSAALSAARVNGSYRFRDSEIRILALPDNKLKVQFDLSVAYDTSSGRSADTGFATGEAALEGNVATYRNSELGSACTITLKFDAGNKLSVASQNSPGECGFGNRASPDGTYRKAKPGRPKFKASAEDAASSARGAAPEMAPIPTSELAQRYGLDADEAFIKEPTILRAMRQLDAEFDGFGVPGDNAGVRVKGGGDILLVCGRTPRATGQVPYYVAYDVTRKSIYFTKNAPDGTKTYGTGDALMKAAHARIKVASCP